MNEIESLRLTAIYCLGCPEITGEQEECLKSFISNQSQYLCLKAMEILQQIGPFWAFRLICCIIGADNPFDAKVMQAYWLSGEVLRPSTDLEWIKIHREFQKQLPKNYFIALQTEEMLCRLKGVKPHHNFSVIRMLKNVLKKEIGLTNCILLLLETINNCLVRSGRIISVNKDNLEVETEKLVWRDSKLFMEKTNEKVKKGFTEDSQPGKYVSLHLGLDRQDLTLEQVKSLSDITKEAIDSVIKRR